MTSKQKMTRNKEDYKYFIGGSGILILLVNMFSVLINCLYIIWFLYGNIPYNWVILFNILFLMFNIYIIMLFLNEFFFEMKSYWRKILVVTFITTVYLSMNFSGAFWIYYNAHKKTQQENMIPIEERFNNLPLPHYELNITEGKDWIYIDGIKLVDSTYTGSMVPNVWGGNTILAKDYPYSGLIQDGVCLGLEEGMIVAYQKNLDFIGHRIIDNNLGNGIMELKGDNNKYSEIVECDKVMWVVVGILWT